MMPGLRAYMAGLLASAALIAAPVGVSMLLLHPTAVQAHGSGDGGGSGDGIGNGAATGTGPG